MIGFWKKIVLKAVMGKAKELHKKGKSIEEIAEQFWAEPKIAEGLNALDISPDELIKMIEKKVKKDEK